MKYLILLLLISTPVQAGKFYLELGIGHSCFCLDDSEEWEQAGGVGARLAAGYRHSHNEYLYSHVSIVHHSQWDTGPPFNDWYETESDHLFYNLGVEW